MVKDFERTGRLPQGFNTAYISLIPKVDNATSLKDFRPISMVGCLYKIVTKLLARRLQHVMSSIIGPQQSGFIRGRQILDGALIAGELIESCKRSNTKATILKLDFHKAFDNVSWNFLDWVMEQMQFPSKWRRWIQSCVMSSTASILLNGSPTPPFKLRRGLRQGDPLSPFLFDLAVETLHLIITKSTSMGLWDGIEVCKHGPKLTHLQYADDTIMFCLPNQSHLMNIKSVRL